MDTRYTSEVGFLVDNKRKKVDRIRRQYPSDIK